MNSSKIVEVVAGSESSNFPVFIQFPPDVHKNFKFGCLHNPSFKHNMDWIRLGDSFFQTSVLNVGCCSYLRNSPARSEQNWLSIYARNFDCHVSVRRPAHVIYCAIRVKVSWLDDSYPNGYPRPFSRYRRPRGTIDNVSWRDRDCKGRNLWSCLGVHAGVHGGFHEFVLMISI